MTTPKILPTLSEGSDLLALVRSESHTKKDGIEHQISYRTAEIIFAGTVVVITLLPMIFMHLLLHVLSLM